MPSDSMNWRWLSRNNVSWAIVDLPEPDTPEKTTILFFGIESVTFLRLCNLAPRTVMWDMRISVHARGTDEPGAAAATARLTLAHRPSRRNPSSPLYHRPAE